MHYSKASATRMEHILKGVLRRLKALAGRPQGKAARKYSAVPSAHRLSQIGRGHVWDDKLKKGPTRPRGLSRFGHELLSQFGITTGGYWAQRTQRQGLRSRRQLWALKSRENPRTPRRGSPN